LPDLHYCFRYDESFHSVAESGTLLMMLVRFVLKQFKPSGMIRMSRGAPNFL
jgi:hypothetical protein